MDTGSPVQNEAETQGSWIPVTPYRPILPKPPPIYREQADLLGQANCLGSECSDFGCGQGPQSGGASACFTSASDTDTGVHNNWETYSITNGSVAYSEVMARWKDVSCGELLALANATIRVTTTEGVGSHTEKDEHSIPHRQTCDLNFPSSTSVDEFSHKATFCEFAPITPEKATGGKGKQVTELQISSTDDQTNQGIQEQNGENYADHCSRELLKPATDPLEGAVSTQNEENHNPDKGETTRQKPRRKKHRPKVITEGKPRGRKPRTPAPAGSIEDPMGKRKYVRKKGLNNNSIEADRASADPKMLEPTTQNGETLIFDAEQQRDDNSTCRLYFDFSNSEIPSQSTTKNGEGIEVRPKAVTRKRGRPKGSSTGSRKYVRKKGLNKDSTSSFAEPTGESIDLKTHEPSKEACTGTEGQPRDENSRCKSSTDSVSESHAKDFNKEEFPSNSSMQPDDRMDMMTPNPSGSPENLKDRRKYVRRNKPTLTEAAENSSDPTVLESTKSCRRPLNFDALGQITDEKSNCKTNLGPDVEPMERDIGRTGLESKSTGKPYQGTEVIQVNMDNAQESIAYNFSGSERQIQRNNMSLPEGLAPSTPLLNKTNQMKEFNTDCGKENPSQLKDEAAANNGHGHSNCNMLQLDTQSSSSKSPNEPECSTYTIQIEQELERGSKRAYYNAGQADASSSNLIGMFYHSSPTYMMSSWAHNIHKKKRTEKGQNSATSSMLHSVTVAKNTTMGKLCNQRNTEDQTALEARSVFPDKKQTFDRILALNPTERLTKKRSRGPTRVRNLASLNKIAERTMQTYPARQSLVDCDVQQVENLKGPPTCREALVAEMGEILARKKRTKKRNVLDYSASCSTNVAKNPQKLILHNHYRLSPTSMGAQHPAIYVGTSTIDSITEQFKHLDITQRSSRIRYQEQNASRIRYQEQNALVPCFMRNTQQNALVPYFMRNQEQNALVLYRRDGTVVPFEGSFDPVKKRRPRPKVELDEETNRVWKLLLENINSEGIDGTDEEKAKWWEEERRVFHGRVDSFIARMHLVQGDRRFSPWKGSVVDSVVGVFLTQNVSDHLSSSAFMSLAARFPLKSQEPICGEETSSVVEEPKLHIMEQEETVECNQKLLHRPTSDLTSMTLHECKQTEEREAVSSNESWGSSVEFLNSINASECKFLNPCESREESYYDPIMSRSTAEIQGTGSMCFEEDQATAIDVLSSQNSVVSSQISMDLSIAQDTERSRSISDSNSEDGDLTNVSKLNDYNGSTSFVELLQSTMLSNVMSQGTAKVSSDGKSRDAHQQCLTNEDSNQKKKSGHLDGPKDLHRASSIAPNSFPPYLNQNSSGQADCYEILGEKTRLPDHPNNYYRNSVTQQSDFTTEFTSQGDVHEAHGRWSNSMEEIKFMTERQQHGLFGDARVVESLSQLRESPDVTQSSSAFDNKYSTDQKKLVPDLNKHDSFSKELNKLNPTPKSKGKRVGKEKKGDFDWDSLRRQVETDGKKRERPATTMDSLDYEAVRCADVNVIANTIKERGMNNMLAERIKDFLNRLVTEHGSIDLEWLRDVPPDKAKEYLLSVRGLGLKSVECVRLLTLHHLAFPVDTNVGRIAVRLGWVPLQPLPESLQLHLLELYPVLESIQKYLWPRLCKLDQRTLYELHYQMITFGKVFCTKSKPNCNACPMRGECRHFASAFASSRLALPGPEEKAIVSANEKITNQDTPLMTNQLPLPISQPTELLDLNNQSGAKPAVNNCEPIIEEPTTPEHQCTEIVEKDIEDTFCEDPDEIPTIQLNMEQFTQNLQNYMQQNMELQEGDMSKALVALRAEAASIPTPKLKNVSRLRTEHQVYELPDSHPLLEGLDQREPDDPGRYLLAIWTPGETPNSIQPPDRKCSYQENGNLCDEKTCFSCNSIRETNSQVVRGTLLIPCRTAMRGSFPLNGTYFQVNEVFADHDSSMNPINVPREWIWNLPRRTVFFGTSVPSIFKGLTTEGIQHCFWRGYVCVRGFDQKTRAPRPLMARLHFPVSKLSKAQGTRGTDDTRR